MGLDCTHIKGRMAKILNKFRFLSDLWRPDRRLVKFEKKIGGGPILSGENRKKFWYSRPVPKGLS